MATPTEQEQMLASLEQMIVQGYLIWDRTIEDIESLEALSAKSYDDMTASEKTIMRNGTHRGAYNFTNLNHISAFCNALDELCVSLGYISIDGDPLATNWARTSFPSKSELTKYATRIKQLSEKWSYLQRRLPTDISRGLPVDAANAMEEALYKSLLVVSELMKARETVWCGMAICGQF